MDASNSYEASSSGHTRDRRNALAIRIKDVKRSLQRTYTENSKEIFPYKEISRQQSQFPCTFMCLWAIYIFTRSVCLSCYRKICGPILVIYKLLTDTWIWNWGLRPRNSFSGNTKLGFSLQCSRAANRNYDGLRQLHEDIDGFCARPSPWSTGAAATEFRKLLRQRRWWRWTLRYRRHCMRWSAAPMHMGVDGSLCSV